MASLEFNGFVLGKSLRKIDGKSGEDGIFHRICHVDVLNNSKGEKEIIETHF